MTVQYLSWFLRYVRFARHGSHRRRRSFDRLPLISSHHDVTSIFHARSLAVIRCAGLCNLLANQAMRYPISVWDLSRKEASETAHIRVCLCAAFEALCCRFFLSPGVGVFRKKERTSALHFKYRLFGIMLSLFKSSWRLILDCFDASELTGCFRKLWNSSALSSSMVWWWENGNIYCTVLVNVTGKQAECDINFVWNRRFITAEPSVY